jgi:hypothetical protein
MLEPLDRADLWELREGDVEADSLEAVVATAARSRGALDLSIGDGLAAMCVGDRLVRLGFSCLGDYAREVLGIQERTAQNMARLSRELRKRPLLRTAVQAGKVRVRKAQTVLPLAVGDAEAEWVELARTLSVGALEIMVRGARADPGEEDEDWRRFRVRLEAEERALVDKALAVAGKVIGPGASRAQRLEAMAQEYLGEHPVEGGVDLEQPCPALRPVEDFLEQRRAQLELESEQWSHLAVVPEPPAPERGFDEAASPEEVDAEIRRLAAMRSSWDDLLGSFALAVKASGIWRILGFSDFSHYCTERLGLAVRTVEQRVAVEKRLWEVPALREALLDRQLSYEQVRLLSRLPTADIPGWITRARALTCIELRRALQAEEEAQMRAARTLTAPVPARVALLLAAAFRAVRAVENRFWSDGKCLVAIARHFLETWKPPVSKRRTLSQRVRQRDLGNCQVPMCSRRAAHAHHVDPRGRGGPTVGANLVGICSCHHLRGVHGGYIRVSGTAPRGLVWVLGGKVWMGPQRWTELSRQA